MYTIFYCSLADSQKGSDASWKDDIEVPTEVHIIRSSVVPIVEVPLTSESARQFRVCC